MKENGLPGPVVLNLRPITNPNAAHPAEHNKKITFNFTIHFSFLHELKNVLNKYKL